MKSIKEALFEEALYCKDSYREAKEKYGEWDTHTTVREFQVRALMNVIEESGYLDEWDKFIKQIAILRGII